MRRGRRISVLTLIRQVSKSSSTANLEIPSEYCITARQLSKAQERLECATQHVQQIKEEVTPAVIKAATHYVKEVAHELKQRKKTYRASWRRYRILQLFSSLSLQIMVLLFVGLLNVSVFSLIYRLFGISLSSLVTFISSALFLAAFIIVKATVQPSKDDVGDALERMRKAQEGIPSLETRHEALRGRFNRLNQNQYWVIEQAKAKKAYDSLCHIANSQSFRLLHTDWRSLRGVPFEDFIANVFEMLGFHVTKTKASGDQGIDLIVIGKGRRIGIQCKGYCDSVGVHAVQEAHAGKSFYHCDGCLVITNSQFTKASRELAAKVGCKLIPGSEMTSLILGRIL
jgi:HJR/Mrr/RecB family endonuclease